MIPQPKKNSRNLKLKPPPRMPRLGPVLGHEGADTGSDFTLNSIHERAETETKTLRGIMDHPFPEPHGGINE